MTKIGLAYINGAVPGFEDFGCLPTDIVKENGLVNGNKASDELDALIIPGGTLIESNDINMGLNTEIKKMAPSVEVVLFTAYADIALAVEGMKRGAFDFIVKPWDNEKLAAVLTAARDKARKAMGRDSSAKGLRMTDACHPAQSEGAMYWGTSKPMTDILKSIQKIAPTDATVLITGENGTGKDVLAREIHAHSLRNGKPMVAVDAGAITETLFESELFGPTPTTWVSSSRRMAARFSWTRSGISRFIFRPSCYAPSRAGAWSGWEAARPSR